jgi:hypothetical protein
MCVGKKKKLCSTLTNSFISGLSFSVMFGCLNCALTLSSLLYVRTTAFSVICSRFPAAVNLQALSGEESTN